MALDHLIETRLETMRHEAAVLNEINQVLMYKKELLGRFDGGGSKQAHEQNADAIYSQAE